MIDLDWLARAILRRASRGHHPYFIGFMCGVVTLTTRTTSDP